jgi:hypothetical protein
MADVKCPKCSKEFDIDKHRLTGTKAMVAGAAAGGYIGAHVGIVGGPLGGIAGTVPGIIVGAALARWGGRPYVRCPHCQKTSKI